MPENFSDHIRRLEASTPTPPDALRRRILERSRPVMKSRRPVSVVAAGLIGVLLLVGGVLFGMYLFTPPEEVPVAFVPPVVQYDTVMVVRTDTVIQTVEIPVERIIYREVEVVRTVEPPVARLDPLSPIPAVGSSRSARQDSALLRYLTPLEGAIMD